MNKFIFAIISLFFLFLLGYVGCGGDGGKSGGGTSIKTYYKDADGDGYSDGTTQTSTVRPDSTYYLNSELSSTSGDCNDNDRNIHPEAIEVCGDGIDNNCDGNIDEGCSTFQTWYRDSDGDGFGDSGSSYYSISPPNGYVSDNTDCNDYDKDINPGVSEVCGDGIDNNCDGNIDEGCSTFQAWYRDSDGDGFGDSGSSYYSASPPNGYVSDNTDCNDFNAAIYPGAYEVCGDGIDQDCDGQDDQDCFLKRDMSKSYNIQDKVSVSNINAQLTKLVIVLPLAQSNPYQDVNNVINNGGEVLPILETDDKYIRWTLTGNSMPSIGQTKEWSYEFDITLYNITADFSKITMIYPYNTNSGIYIWYTGASGDYVDPSNVTIQNIGDMIWSQSSDILDYTRRCYEYVASNYQYLNPGSGIKPLSVILSSGGGDCGNLSSIFISLIRYKKIPSRHLVTVRPDGSYHVWADFYLEKYGWIPVDVTYKLSDPTGDYFGKVAINGNGIIFTKEVNLPIAVTNTYDYFVPLLQNYGWWYWGYGGLTPTYELNATLN